MELSPEMGVHFAAASVGEKEITEAVNAVQRAYEDFMGPAWEKAQPPDEESMKAVTARGIAFVIALGAFHTVKMHGASAKFEEFMADAVVDVAGAMLKQVAEHRKEQAVAKRREGQA
jgi:hypothetical protein